MALSFDLGVTGCTILGFGTAKIPILGFILQKAKQLLVDDHPCKQVARHWGGRQQPPHPSMFKNYSTERLTHRVARRILARLRRRVRHRRRDPRARWVGRSRGTATAIRANTSTTRSVFLSQPTIFNSLKSSFDKLLRLTLTRQRTQQMYRMQALVQMMHWQRWRLRKCC